MPNIQSQKKRNRQNEKRRIRNSQVKSAIRTANKKVLKAIESKESDAEVLKGYLMDFIQMIDTATSKGVVHQNTAARKKSRLSKRVNSALVKMS